MRYARFIALGAAILGAAWLMHGDLEHMREECAHHKGARFVWHAMREHMCVSNQGAYIVVE